MRKRFLGRRRARAAQPTKLENSIPFKQIPWRRLFGYLRPYRGRMALAIFALVGATALGLLFPLLIISLLSSVTQNGDMQQLNLLAGALVGMFLLQAGFTFTQSYLLAFVGEHIVFDLRTSLYAHLQKLSLEFYATRRVGEIVSRLSSDVTQLRALLTTNLTQLLNQVLMLVGSIVILVTLNAGLTLFILALVPILILVAFLFGSRVQRVSAHVQDQLADATVVAEEGLQGVRIVKSFGREEYESQRYRNAMTQTFHASLKLALLNALFLAVMAFLGFSAIAAILWYGGREVIAGNLSLAMISGFLIYGVTIAANLGGLAGLYTQLRAALGGVQRVFEILDTSPGIRDAPGAQSLATTQGHLYFDGVYFHYEDLIPVIQGVTLDIAPGEILALVGPSGAGKSTLFNLIPRLYDPTQGSVQIDGHDLRALTQASIRSHIAIVPQETILFGGTVRENILYGKLDASQAEMIAAAQAANAHEFICALPEQYDTLVGERGMKLSGGQRQRIAIARALLKNPRILLLDEATSSLDNESEALVQEALQRLMQNRTTVIIAHRLSTIKGAHRIAVMADGQIIELGTHAELLARDGLYARLYAMQFRDADEFLGRVPNAAAAPAPPARETSEPRGGLFGMFGRNG